MKALGRHLLTDLYDCDERLLDDREYIETQLHAAAEAAGARILGALFHRFSPHGVTGVLVRARKPSSRAHLAWTSLRRD